MCECISKVERLLVGQYGGKYKRKIIKSIRLNKIIPFKFEGEEPCVVKVAIQFDIEREGAKSVAKEIMVASYCPFCGDKYAD